MSRFLATLPAVAMALAGAGLWATQVPALRKAGAFHLQPNPLGLKKSPYGEVIAIAMQGPIADQWNSGMIGGQRAQAAESVPVAELPPNPSLTRRVHHFLDQLNDVKKLRTNPKAASEAHKLHVRRNIENRLKFAYQFDPSNFGNYNSYHFFITQPQLGTRPVLTRKALELAAETIQYSIGRTDDPRPALTAAAAAENVLQLMFEQPERYPTAHMRQQLDVMNFALQRYEQLAAQWDADGTWEELSLARMVEAEDRYHLTAKLREAAVATIQRLESAAASDDHATR